jgi:hypothetical protein
MRLGQDFTRRNIEQKACEKPKVNHQQIIWQVEE